MGRLIGMIVLSVLVAAAMGTLLRVFMRRITDIQKSKWGDDA